ncbi:MAG: DUF2207 domain-containing protein [Candidatus Binatia bacterium]
MAAARLAPRCRAAGAAVAALVVLAATPAAARSLAIGSFEAAVDVARDGSLTVVETISPRFEGQWNGLYRSIPVEYRSPQGFGYALLLDVLGATDAADHPLRLELSRERHYRKIKVWVPDARDATRTVHLVYRVENGLRFFVDHDELYWNVTGDEWDVPIEAAEAQITLPEGVTGVRAVAYTGPYGSRDRDADLQVTGGVVRVRMRRPLAFREGLTVAIGWDKGVVTEPGLLTRAGYFLRGNWPLGIPVVVFAGMLSVWYRRGRDPRGRTIMVAYEPPAGLRPAEVGTLVDNAADLRDLTATLVDLAVRGFLRIEARQTATAFGLLSRTTYAFHLRRPRPEWTDLRDWERTFLDALFPGTRTDVELAALENVFYRSIPGIRDGIFDGLLGHGYYARRPDHVRLFWGIAAVVTGIVLALGGAYLAERGQAAPLAYVVGAGLSTLVMGVFARVMPARTVAGARAREAVLGFEDFLSRVESDRFARVVRTPELFERLLPFAMALGVDRAWVRAFADICTQPPDWYRGPDGSRFAPRAFGDDLRHMASAAGASLASAPRSSDGSGFSGGGSSGGGFGGGGGGGF